MYFADELAAEPPSITLPMTLNDYLSLFTSAMPEQRIGDASTLYLWSRNAARKIASLKPDARIIITLREPASFLRSLHLQYVQIGLEKEQDLGRALALKDIRRNGQQISQGGFWGPLLLYSDHLTYVHQLRRYLDAFSTDQILILIYDDFRNNNQATIRTILRFLGVCDTVPIPTIEANPSVRVRTDLMRLLDAVSQGRGRGSRIVKAAVNAVTTQPFRRAAHKAVRDRFVYPKPQAPDHELMLEIRRRCKPEVVTLSEYLKRDMVTLWGYHDIG